MHVHKRYLMVFIDNLVTASLHMSPLLFSDPKYHYGLDDLHLFLILKNAYYYGLYFFTPGLTGGLSLESK